MAESTICKTLRDGTLVVSDNGGANSYTFAFEVGDFSLDIPGVDVQNFLDRGSIGATPCIRDADEQPMTGSFTFHMRDMSDATDVTGSELIFGPSGKIGSSWVSTMGASTSASKTYTLVWTVAYNTETSHTLTCNFCVIRGSVSEGYPNTYSLSFTSYDVAPTVT